jgi:hypothetical protein
MSDKLQFVDLSRQHDRLKSLSDIPRGSPQPAWEDRFGMNCGSIQLIMRNQSDGVSLVVNRKNTFWFWSFLVSNSTQDDNLQIASSLAPWVCDFLNKIGLRQKLSGEIYTGISHIQAQLTRDR